MKRRIFLIDDDFQMLTELTEVLEGRQLGVLTAASGQDALHMAVDEMYDVALVDIRLPDINGVDLISRLRTKRPEAVYVLMTAYASLDNAIQAVHSGAFDYLMKPFQIRDVLQSLERGFAFRDHLVRQQDEKKNWSQERGLLEMKLDGLRRLNRVFNQREEEILRLKKEVNSLLDRLHMAHKYEEV